MLGKSRESKLKVWNRLAAFAPRASDDCSSDDECQHSDDKQVPTSATSGKVKRTLFVRHSPGRACEMGADPTEPPSGFSVVRDSIRRDREALFLQTRDAIPTIDASDDDSDGSSDAELPVFFTEASAADAAPTAPLARVDPVPLAPAPAPRAAAELDDAAALAAFERAAAESMAREEARAAQIVARHLTARAGSADEDAATDHDDHLADDDDDDDDITTVRADRRSLPRRRPSARAPPAPVLPPPAPPTFPDADDDPSRVASSLAGVDAGAPASVSDAVSALYTGWLSGAAGRLASNATGGNRTHRLTHQEPTSVSPAGFDFDVAAVEADFAAAGRLDADGNLPPDVASAMPRASVTLDLERSLGGIDLDALLARLSTPEGAETLASLRGERAAVDHDQLRIQLDDEDDDAPSDAMDEAEDDDETDDADNRTASTMTSSASGSYAEITDAARGTIASEYATLRDSPRSTGRGRGGAGPAPRVSPTGAGAPRGTTLDPYGRGTRRARLASARSAPRSAPGAPRANANDDAPVEPGFGFFPSFPRSRPAPTVRLNAWETMEPEAAAAAGFAATATRRVEDDPAGSADADGEANPRASAPTVGGSGSSRRAPGSPSADAADAAAARASDAAKAARAAAMRAAREADAREAEAERVRRRTEAEEAEAEAAAAKAEAAVSAAAAAAKAEEARRLEVESRAMAARQAALLEEQRARDAAVAERLRLEGNERFRSGDFAGASDAYTAALAKRPGDPSALANRAAASIRLGAYADAERDASECLRVEPGHQKALWRRAEARRGVGDHRGALEDLEALSEALPYNQGVAKDLADARRAVKHADRGVDGTVAELERHVRARKEAAAREEEAWEARRRAGIKAHRDRAVAAAAAAAEAAAAKKETEAKREAEGVAAEASSA